jgi:hypothetical protein
MDTMNKTEQVTTPARIRMFEAHEPDGHVYRIFSDGDSEGSLAERKRRPRHLTFDISGLPEAGRVRLMEVVRCRALAKAALHWRKS